jgi:ribonucleoside-diphosphate reductase alpha chain
MTPISRVPQTAQAVPQSNSDANCPDCSAPVTRQSGCVACLQCGWSRCG